MVQKGALPSLNVTMAGVQFRSPIGVAPIGNPFGRQSPEDPESFAEVNTEVLLKHVRAGAGYIYLMAGYATEATIRKVQERARLEEGRPRYVRSQRALRIETPLAPYGVEGMYWVNAPFWVTGEVMKLSEPAIERLIKVLKGKKPKDVPLIIGVSGLGDLPDAYVDGAKRREELGADLVELNFGCPQPPAMRGAVDDFFQKRFPPRFQGALIGDNDPDIVEGIIREVVKAVSIPVGVKLTAETGFPRIVGLAKRIRDAGAKYIQVVNGAIGIAPPDIYNRGKPLWPFMDGNPFCLASGSWIRVLCYRDVAAIARFVPGIDIAAAGGLVMPQHCVEVMMLGASLSQLCTGVIEQGRSLIRQSNEFMKKFMVDQGYQSVAEFIGLGQQHIKYQEDVDLTVGNVIAELDEEKCTKCGCCIDNICTALYSERGKIKIAAERCTGCGGCILACQPGALKLVLRE